jgi:hypothetical protein
MAVACHARPLESSWQVRSVNGLDSAGAVINQRRFWRILQMLKVARMSIHIKDRRPQFLQENEDLFASGPKRLLGADPIAYIEVENPHPRYEPVR